jgi:hypothetical protein
VRSFVGCLTGSSPTISKKVVPIDFVRFRALQYVAFFVSAFLHTHDNGRKEMVGLVQARLLLYFVFYGSKL